MIRTISSGRSLRGSLIRVLGAHKIKIGESLDDDVARVTEAREIIGRAPLLMVDVSAYNAESAYAAMRRLDPFDIHWMEEPVMSEDFVGLERLGRRRTIAIAAGESHMMCHEFKRLLDTGAVVWGTGIGLAAAVHYVAAVPDDPFALQSPHPTLVEYDCSQNPLRDDLLVDPILPKGGMLPVRQGPGLGIEVDETMLQCFAAA